MTNKLKSHEAVSPACPSSGYHWILTCDQLIACHPQVPAAEDNRDPGAQPAAGAGPDLGKAEAGHLTHGGVH